jgi:hypothetical protein
VHRCSFVQNDILGWACLQATCFLDKRKRHSRTRTQKLDFMKERSTETGRAVNTHPKSIRLDQSKFFMIVCKKSINKNRV